MAPKRRNASGGKNKGRKEKVLEEEGQ